MHDCATQTNIVNNFFAVTELSRRFRFRKFAHYMITRLAHYPKLWNLKEYGLLPSGSVALVLITASPAGCYRPPANNAQVAA
jgi:hypothetical protein